MAPKGGKPPEAELPPDEGTKPAAPGYGQRKPDKLRHRHDAFELEIDADNDSEMTAVVDRKTGNAAPSAPDPFPSSNDEASEEPAAIDLSLPASSEDEVLPLFVPPRTNTKLKPFRSPTPAPIRGPVPKTPPNNEPDVLSLFDADVDPADTGEAMPIHIPIGKKLAPTRPPTPPRGLPILPPSPPPSPGTAKKKARFASGLTGGMNPLDDAEFEVTPLPKRKPEPTVFTRRSGPAPMAHSSRVRRRWFQFSLRDILLLLLVVLLGLAIYLGWNFYQEYRHHADLVTVVQRQDTVEKDKVEVITKSQHKKERDIP